MDRVSTKTWVLAGAAVAAVGAAAWMYRNKWRKEDDWINGKTDDLETAEDRMMDALNKKKIMMAQRASAQIPTPRGRLAKAPRSGSLAFLAEGEPTPMDEPYGCNSFDRACAPGDVGGCESMRQSCSAANNSVRMTMARPGECEQFRTQCMAGDYGSCDQYTRGCQYEGN